MVRILFGVMSMGILFAACFPGASMARSLADRTDSVPLAAFTGKPATLNKGPSRTGAVQAILAAASGHRSRGDAEDPARILQTAYPVGENRPPQQGRQDEAHRAPLPHHPDAAVMNPSPQARANGLYAPRPSTELAAARESYPRDHRRMETLLQPQGPQESTSTTTSASEKAYQNLEIQVSHSEHVFKLFGVLPGGNKDLLKECRVGLGSPTEFPTPVGVYYVTHIYDKDPLWIPPPNRAWAVGQSPSNRVYGGTMAPLLKKRLVNSKKKTTDFDDYVSEEVRLEDHGYRFHGTNAPRSIGHNQSHGCVRMLPPDAKEAADLIKEHVGIAGERTSENGDFVILKAPVRLNLIK